MIPSQRTNWVALFITNFLGVLNDNFLKNCIIFTAATWKMPSWMNLSQVISCVSAALILPYLIFSPLAAHLGCKLSHKKILRTLKLIELPIMILACVAFWFQWIWLALFSVLLMGIQSSLYSPAKYSLIRDIGGEENVSFGSGIFESMAFLGILAGTVIASIISDHYQFYYVCALFMGLALLGYMVSRRISCSETNEKRIPQTIRPLKFIITSYHFAKKIPLLNLGVFGASCLWFIGGILQMNLVIYCQHELFLSHTETGIIMAIAAIGIATGCYFTALISGKRVLKQLIPIGLFLISCALLCILLFKPNTIGSSVLIFIITFSGGIFQVPCLALIQRANIGRRLDDMIAYTNLITFAFVLVGTALFSIITAATHENAYAVFGVLLVICMSLFVMFLLKLQTYSEKTKR